MSERKNASSSMKTQSQENQKQQQQQSSSSYDAFARVDAMVAKPVYGSDGAARWQAFQSQPSSSSGGGVTHTSSASAPKAPLKKLDRAVGFTSWQQERQHEESIRAGSDAAPLHAGYLHFQKKNDPSAAAEKKRVQAILDRKRPEKKPYYLPADTFQGWKFDYVFSTRDEWGTGYFWDGMDSLKELQGNTSKVGEGSVERETKKRSNTDTAVTKPDEKSSDSVAEKKKKKTKKQAATVVIRDDPTHPLEQVMAAIQRRKQQTEHLQQVPAGSSSTSTDHGWESAIDPASGKTYYYHRVTGERSWDRPPSSNDTTTQPLPSGWKSAIHAESGNEYYYHEESGETTWDMPSTTTKSVP